jgi:hypothetical protein
MAESTVTKYLDPAGSTRLLLERRDKQNNRTYYGRNLNLSAAQTDATWQIYAEDVVGNTFLRQFANGSDAFNFQWNLRTTYFSPPAFINAYSLQLTGNTNCYGIVPHSSSIDFANNAAFSGAMWIKMSSSAAITLMQKTSTGTGNTGYTLEIDGSQRLIFTHRGLSASDSISVRTPTLTINNGQWHFIAWTKATGLLASTVKIYYDGVSQTLTTVNNGLLTTTNNALPLYIGSNISGASRLTGNIDEVAIWNAELTLAEIQEVYNSNNGVIDLEAGSGNISSALTAWWRMGDGEYTTFPTIPDDKGTNDMTLQSGITTGDLETEVPP